MKILHNIFFFTFCVFLKCVIADNYYYEARIQDKTGPVAINPTVLHTLKASPFNELPIISRNSPTSYEEHQHPEQLLSVHQLYKNSKFNTELLTDGDLIHYRSQPLNRRPRVPPSSRSFSNDRGPPPEQRPPPNRGWSSDKISSLDIEPPPPNYGPPLNLVHLFDQEPPSDRGPLVGPGPPHGQGPPPGRGPPPWRGPPRDRSLRPLSRGPPPRGDPPPGRGPPPDQGPLGGPMGYQTGRNEYPFRNGLIDREQPHQQNKYYLYINLESQNSQSSVSPLSNMNPSSNTNYNNSFNRNEESVSSLYKSEMKKTGNSSKKSQRILFQAQPVVPEE